MVDYRVTYFASCRAVDERTIAVVPRRQTPASASGARGTQIVLQTKLKACPRPSSVRKLKLRKEEKDENTFTRVGRTFLVETDTRAETPSITLDNSTYRCIDVSSKLNRKPIVSKGKRASSTIPVLLANLCSTCVQPVFRLCRRRCTRKRVYTE